MTTTSEETTNCKFISSQIKALRLLPGNKQCADCQECLCPQCAMKEFSCCFGGLPDADEDDNEPHWISEGLEIIVCSECKAIHERITLTTFRSLQVTTDWTLESFQKVKHISNDATNAIYEREMPPAFRKPTRCFDWRFREHWIISKYIKKLFKQRNNPPRYLWGTKTGYLWKRGRDDSLFMRRWFVLDVENTPVLKYYSDANEENLKGEIPLMSLDLCLTREDKLENPNAMQIFCPEERGSSTRVIYLYSDTAKELVEWYQTVRIRKYHQIRTKEPDMVISMVLRSLGSDILHEGFLHKTGRKGTETYRKRWFVLHGRNLHYFRSSLDANPKGTISLDGEGISVILTGQRDRLGFHFKLKTPGRIYPLIAEDEQQRELWIKAIHQSCYQDQILASRIADKAATMPIRLTQDPSEPTPTRSNTTPAPTHITPTTQEESGSDSDSMEDMFSGLNYIYLQNGSILANETWDPEHGLMVKGEVLMLKIPPEALAFDGGDGDITVTVQKVDLVDISKNKDFGDVSLMVKCEGSPAAPVVSLPMRMELYHCGILSNKENVKPVIWWKNDSTWTKLTEEDDKLSCEVLEHTFCIETKYFGSLAASLEGESVVGKRMRCAAFCKFEENSENLDVIVYIFNNHVSDFMWKMIKVNENSNNYSTLMDISNEFSLLKENKDLLLSIDTLKGLQLMPGNFTTLKIPFGEIWSKSFVSYHIELIQTAKTGHCKLIITQEQSAEGSNSAVLNLKNNSELDFASPAVGKLERQLTPHSSMAPPVPERAPERHSSDAVLLEGPRDIDKPHFASQKKSEEEEIPSGSQTLLPFPVKQELAKVLDPAPEGKNWRAFAIEMGINHTVCESLVAKVSPTMDVFKYCEYVDSTVDEVKEALRFIRNNEAFEILARYFTKS